MQFVLFTDNLKDLSIREACCAAKQAGFDGLDLTLRPGGHVLPENAEPGLAAADQTADEESFAIPMVSTGVNASDSPFAEEVIAAAHHRDRAFKMGYWRYEPFGTAAKQLDDARRKLDGVIELTRRYHIRPCVHVHSGPLLSNSPFIYQLLKDHSPADVGAYVDSMHMNLEGGLSGWEMTLDLLAPWVALVAVKNYLLQPAARDTFGQQRFDLKYVPLADGMAPLPQFFRRLKEIGYDGIVSLSSEYKSERSLRRLKTPELLEQSAADISYLKQLIAKLPA